LHRFDKNYLGEKAKEFGFVRDTLEKVYRLAEILKYINSDKLLVKRLVLKGGTAINLTVFNLPRLSVDIDLDYDRDCSLEEMLEERQKITDRIYAYMKENEYSLAPNSRLRHSLDSYVFNYQNAGGNPDNIKIEINYSLRAHIFEPIGRAIITNALESDYKIRTLLPIELFAAKINALISRAAARDLYDMNNMVEYGLFDEADFDMLRKCVVFYAAISAETINKTFDTSEIDSITFSKIHTDLFPVIRDKGNFKLDEKKKAAKTYIEELMKLTPEEKEFLDRFENNEYRLDLLFKEDEIIKRLENHPMALWKMQR
jgi:predicted nucleotidyltransferase component of viral defense system